MTVAAQQVAVNSRKVRASLETMLALDSSEWGRAEVAGLTLEPTPIERQPSAYVRRAWRDRPRSDITELQVSSLTGAKAVAVRLQWAAPRPNRRISDINVYADACAVLFPADGVNLTHETMGSEKHPVQAWHWRAGTNDPFVITATGVGTAQREGKHGVVAAAGWNGGRWQVVFARALEDDGVSLAHGARVPVAFAVWSGAAGERAGLKSVSPLAQELVVGG